MGGVPWSDEEIERLRRNYPGASWLGLLNMFKPRTRAAIQVQAITLGIKRIKNGREMWYPTEKERLAALWPNASWDEISASLPRHSKGSIGKMAASMKLRRDCARRQSPYPIIRQLRESRRTRGVEQTKLARKLGCHHVQIAKWERGELVPRLRTFFDWVQAMGFELKLEKPQ